MSKAGDIIKRFQYLIETDVSNLGKVPDVANKKDDSDNEEDANAGKSIKGESTSDGVFPHHHTFTIDSKGNGKTTGVVGGGEDHEHTIETFNIRLGGDPEHTHNILVDDVDGDGKPDESLSSHFQEHFPSKYDWSRWNSSNASEDTHESPTKDTTTSVNATSLMNKFI